MTTSAPAGSSASLNEKNKAVLRNLAERFNKKDMKGFEDIYAPNVSYKGTGELANADRTTFMEFVKAIVAAFPDARMKIDDVIAEADRVAYRMTFTGTHKQDFMGITATNRKITVRSLGLARIGDTRIIEEWENYDEMGMMRQLGVIPPAE